MPTASVLVDFDRALQILRPRTISQRHSNTGTAQPARPGKAARDIAQCVNVLRKKKERRTVKKKFHQATETLVEVDAGEANLASTGADAASAGGANLPSAGADVASAGEANLACTGADARESKAAVLQKQNTASAAGCPIGSHIEIQWQKDTWYSGVVTDFNLDTGEHFVVYDDGEDEQDEDLQVMKFRFIGGGGVEDSTEADEEPTPTEDPWFCTHCDFSSQYLFVATAHEQSCLAHQSQEAISRKQLLWSPDIDEQHVVEQLGWTCGSQTFGSDKLAMKHFHAFNKFRLLRELYRPTRSMCKHEVAQHAARAASYGNWYPVRCAESIFAPIPLLSYLLLALSISHSCHLVPVVALTAYTCSLVAPMCRVLPKARFVVDSLKQASHLSSTCWFMSTNGC